jgi:hypothetical protein
MRHSIIIIIEFFVVIAAATRMLDALQLLMFLVGTLTYLESKRLL